MYDELVISLRNNADHYTTVEGAAGLVHLLTDAADAIEELSRRETPMKITELHVEQKTIAIRATCKTLTAQPVVNAF